MARDITELLAPGADSDSDVVQDIVLDSDSESDSGDAGTASAGPADAEPEAEMPQLDSDDEGFFQQVERQVAQKKSSSTFAGMGLDKLLLTNIQRKGFKQPTPIQRKAIPPILDGQDVVGMARTGSGKTAAFVLPLVQRLKAHSARVGARALILSPSRELAMQTLRVVRDFSKKSDLRSVLLVGGDSLEDQFKEMMNNPDVVIATPGRFMHLKVEMGLDLSSVGYVVFDEADRLFEMGFAEQLTEIIASLPEIRQTLLFSATLPSTLVDFVKAGLRNPLLVRLDADQKISDQLQMGFFAIKDQERDAALLYVLQDIIGMPLMTAAQKAYLDRRANEAVYDETGRLEKRDRLPHANELPSPKATIVFVPTKHHVEYVAQLLRHQGYAVALIYGSLDQAARREQLYLFKAGKVDLLVVTDVAARGVDIPMLANVVNYNTPTSARVFVHRVGRTARAGHTGWAYTLVRQRDLPYVADLEVFLGRPISADPHNTDYSQRLALGAPLRSGVEFQHEQVQGLLKREDDLLELERVATRGEKLWLKTREAASKQGVRRAREVMENFGWDRPSALAARADAAAGGTLGLEAAKEELLAKLGQRKVKETVFEIKKSGFDSAAQLMSRRRAQILPVQERAKRRREAAALERSARGAHDDADDADLLEGDAALAASGGAGGSRAASNADNGPAADAASDLNRFKDPQFYMSHAEPLSSLQDRGYSLQGAAGFADAARGASFTVGEEGAEFSSKQITRWDRKKGKYVKTGGGEDNVKYIRGEGGQRIPASLKSGRFEAWKQQHKISGLGTYENDAGNGGGGRGGAGGAGGRFKHNQQKAPKAADKARDDYKSRKERVAKAVASGLRVKGHAAPTTGLQSSGAIQKQRAAKQKRWEKSNQPGRKKRKT